MKREVLLEKWEDDKYENLYSLIQIDVILSRYTEFCKDGGRRNITVSIEEFAELIQVITKDMRGFPDRFNYIEELADVTICAIYMVQICGLSWENISGREDPVIANPLDCIKLLNEAQSNLIQWLDSSCCKRYLEDSVKNTTSVVEFLMNRCKISREEINKMMCIKIDRINTVFKERHLI